MRPKHYLSIARHNRNATGRTLQCSLYTRTRFVSLHYHSHQRPQMHSPLLSTMAQRATSCDISRSSRLLSSASSLLLISSLLLLRSKALQLNVVLQLLQTVCSNGFVPLAPTLAMGTILAVFIVAQGFQHRIAGKHGGKSSSWVDCTCLKCPAGRSLPRGATTAAVHCGGCELASETRSWREARVPPLAANNKQRLLPSQRRSVA
jgi:hypothetical protein